MTVEKNVYVDGVFDLFHEGHINFLRTAQKHGRLIVGVHSDAFVMTYKRRPFINERTRYEVVRACRYVDEIVEGVGLIDAEMISQYAIGQVFHGDDLSEEQVHKYYSAAIKLGIYAHLSYTKGISSTQLIKDIESRFTTHQFRHDHL